MARNEMDEALTAAVDPIQFLQSQHREVEELFKEIEETSARAEKKRASLLAHLARTLEIHAQLEEKLVYPLGEDVDKKTMLESLEEHAVMRDLLKKLDKLSPKDEKFLPRLTVLKEVIEHHVKEEESEFFPKLREEIDPEELAEVGEEVQEMFEMLQEKRKMPAKKAAATRKKK